MKKIILVGFSAVAFVAICAVVIYAQISNTPSMPPVEINARFASADKNGDSVLSKEEFASYLVKMKHVKHSTKETERICPETGLPCEHDDANSSDCCNNNAKIVATNANGEKGCCSEGKNAGTVQAKFSNKGETKNGGCCGDKDKTQTTNTKKADSEKGCCGGKDKTKTADTSKANIEKSCCSDHSKETKKETNSATELTVTDSENPVAVEKTEIETKISDVREINSNDKQ
jgi:hypothetical protein